MDTYPFKDVMSALGLGIQDVANFIGVARNHTHMIYKGQRGLGDAELIKFSKLYILSCVPAANPTVMAASRKSEMDALRQGLSAKNFLLLKQWKSVKSQIDRCKSTYLQASNVLARINAYSQDRHKFDEAQLAWLEDIKAFWSAKLRDNDTAALFALLAKENAIKQELAFNRKVIQSGLSF